MMELHSIAQLAKRLVFPPKCLFCGKLLPEDGLYCEDCLNRILFVNAEHSANGQAAVRFLVGKHFSRCYSACYYAEPLRRVFLRYKFSGSYHYSKLFGRWMADAFALTGEEPFDCVTWAPLHPLRRWRRGYDQAELLAREVSVRLGVPLVRTIRKARRTRAQSGLSNADARSENVSGAYRPIEGLRLDGKRVLLVDDVITTGATLENAAAALSRTGAKEIVCLTLARSHR